MTKRLALLLVLLYCLAGCGGGDVVQSSNPGLPPLIEQGRQRLLEQDGPTTVAAIDALPAEQASQIYQNVGLFDEDPEAVQAVGAITASVFGAGAVYELMAPLDDDGQSVVVAFARNLDPSVPEGLSRCQDSLTAIGAAQLLTGRNPEVISLLTPPITNMPEFHALRELSPATLPEAERATLKSIRDRLTYPANGQPIQKVMMTGDVQRYLNGTFDPKVFGFQAVLSDVENLDTASEVIEGLRLDYPGGFAGQTVVGALVFFQDATFHMNVPYGPANGGTRTDGYPFTGNGFTATVLGNAIPEWTVPREGVNIQDGSQLFLIDDLGNRTLQATFQGGVWVLAGQSRGEPAPVRELVERPARYRGEEVYVISQDDRFYYANSTRDAGLLDQVQVGRGEFRGKISRSDPELVF